MVVQAVEIPIRLSLVVAAACSLCLLAQLSSLCLLVVLCVVVAWHKF